MATCEWSTLENDPDPCPYLVIDGRLRACHFHAAVATRLIDGFYTDRDTVKTITAHRRSRAAP